MNIVHTITPLSSVADHLLKRSEAGSSLHSFLISSFKSSLVGFDCGWSVWKIDAEEVYIYKSPYQM